MKSLELKINKRLLIVEMTGELETLDLYGWNLRPVKKICNASELTQSLIEPFLDKKTDEYWIYWYRDYTVVDEELHDAYVFLNPKESFISAIESKGYHWEENPVIFKENEMNWEKRHKNRIDWERSELRTFNPDKCIICEIL